MKLTIENPRQLRGLAILSMGNTITQIHRNTYLVKSQTGVGEYEVRGYRKTGVPHNRYTCTCPDFKEHQQDCKHIYAVKFSKKLKEGVQDDVEKEVPDEIKFKPINCPECNSEDIIKRGKRHDQKGYVQVFGCKKCGYRFTPDNGFNGMKHTAKAITLSMDLYFKGISYRKICDHLHQFYDVEVNQTTPMRWIRKYMKLLAQYSEKYKVDVGKIWHTDEMTIFIKKEGEKKYYEWIWNVMDAKTRYLLACRITKERFEQDAQKPLKDAKKCTDIRPDAIVTDGLQAYRNAVKDEFYDNNAFVKNPHLRLRDFETRPNNNILERLNGTVRERMKVMRSLSTNEGADAFADGMRTYYNYIRPHQALDGMTPAEVAGIPINLSGNRWLSMIELTKRQEKDRTNN